MHWTGAIEHRLEKDPVLHRLDVAECVACALQALEVRTEERPVDAITSLVGSGHLLKAVIDATRSAAVEYESLADAIQTTYLTMLSRAVELGYLKPAKCLNLIVGMEGKATASQGIEVPSYANYVVSLASISEQHALLFAKVLDEAACPIWAESFQLIVRRVVCEALFYQKGYGSSGKSNFYSVLALGERTITRTRLLRALAEFDFLPRAEDLARKKGVRGRELERALTEARGAPSYALRRQAPSEMVQLSSLFEGTLSSENLKALRDQHLGRQALAAQQVRQLNNALEATGLQGMPWTRASNVRNPGIIE